MKPPDQLVVPLPLPLARRLLAQIRDAEAVLASDGFAPQGENHDRVALEREIERIERRQRLGE